MTKNPQSRLVICNGFFEDDTAGIIHSYYADWPLHGIPKFVVRRLLDKWSQRNDVFYIMAYEDGVFAGFVLAQTLGTQPWRVLLKQPAIVFPFSFIMWLRRRTASLLHRVHPRQGPQVSDLQDPVFSEAPAIFADRKILGKMGNIEFIYVVPGFRGKRIGKVLLDALTTELQRYGVEWLSAYISGINKSSIRMFQKAGFEIFSISPGSLQAWIRIETSPMIPPSSRRY